MFLAHSSVDVSIILSSRGAQLVACLMLSVFLCSVVIPFCCLGLFRGCVVTGGFVLTTGFSLWGGGGIALWVGEIASWARVGCG